MMFGSPLLLLLAVLSASSAIVTASTDENFYRTLGVESTASQKDIKRAFRKLAMKYHPDKNKDPDAEKKFQKIARAYEVLSNEETRQKYDKFGSADDTNHQPGAFNFNDFFRQFDEAQGFRAQNGGGGRKGSREKGSYGFSFGLDDFQMDFEDMKSQGSMFDSIFGGNDGGADDGVDGGGGLNSIFSDFFGDLDHVKEVHTHRSARASSAGHCETITERLGNMIQTRTVCS